jgi:hypothetical protein
MRAWLRALVCACLHIMICYVERPIDSAVCIQYERSEEMAHDVSKISG